MCSAEGWKWLISCSSADTKYRYSKTNWCRLTCAYYVNFWLLTKKILCPFISGTIYELPLNLTVFGTNVRLYCIVRAYTYKKAFYDNFVFTIFIFIMWHIIFAIFVCDHIALHCSQKRNKQCKMSYPFSTVDSVCGSKSYAPNHAERI